LKFIASEIWKEVQEHDFVCMEVKLEPRMFNADLKMDIRNEIMQRAKHLLALRSCSLRAFYRFRAVLHSNSTSSHKSLTTVVTFFSHAILTRKDGSR
jgi:hypothetical protein